MGLQSTDMLSWTGVSDSPIFESLPLLIEVLYRSSQSLNKSESESESKPAINSSRSIEVVPVVGAPSVFTEAGTSSFSALKVDVSSTESLGTYDGDLESSNTFSKVLADSCSEMAALVERVVRLKLSPGCSLERDV